MLVIIQKILDRLPARIGRFIARVANRYNEETNTLLALFLVLLNRHR
jgi:hypothetical protein